MLVPAAALALFSGGPCVQLDADLERGGDLRPALSGPTETVITDDGRYAVHFTDSGEDAVSDQGDSDGNGRFDGIDRVLEGLAVGGAAFEDDGWRLPLPDNGGGGTDEIDVYVRDIDAFGYAHWVPTAEGSSCYMELDPRNDAVGAGISESVAAHELHHCVQYAYTTASDSWIYEATSTYQQYLFFDGPALDLALAVLWNQRLRGMGRAMDTTGGRFEYAGFVVMKQWSDRSGDRRAVEALWQTLAEEPDWWEAFDIEAGSRFDESFEVAFARYAQWNLFACRRDDGLHYDPSTHPCTVLPDVSVDVVELEPNTDRVDFEHTDVPMTALYAELPAAGSADSLEVACTVEPEEAGAVVVLVALDVVGVELEAALARGEGGATVALRTEDAVDPEGSFGLIGVSVGEVPAQIRCGLGRTPPIEPEAGCTCASSLAGPGSGVALLLLFGLGSAVRRRS